MTTGHVEVRVRHLTRLAILDLGGDITRQAELELDAAYVDAAAVDPAAVLLNFAKVEYINSTGIALLVGLLAKARGEGREVFAYGLSPHYAEIFEITRLADFMRVVEDEDAAVRELAA
jgi:anti-anti-sigma factor